MAVTLVAVLAEAVVAVLAEVGAEASQGTVVEAEACQAAGGNLEQGPACPGVVADRLLRVAEDVDGK